MDRFCSDCGARHEVAPQSASQCGTCGARLLRCPDLLTTVAVFANDKLLLIRRGEEPYKGTWATPGGFVEHNEAVEVAAARELREETGLCLNPAHLFACGAVSLTFLNQVHFCFVIGLDYQPEIRPHEPEILEARWFARNEFPAEEVWGPFRGIDPDIIYRPSKTGKLALFAQTDGAFRSVSTNINLLRPWRNAFHLSRQSELDHGHRAEL